MTTEAEVQTSEVSAQAEWDAVAKERETGVRAAEEPPVASVKPDVVDPLQELREKYEKLEARTRNAEGHIGGLNHNQKQMQETLQAASKAATQQVSAAPTQAQVSQAMQDPAEWAQLKGAYPEWANATEKFFDAKLDQIKGQQLDQAAIDKIVSERVERGTAVVRTEVIDAHLDSIVDSDWHVVVKSPEFGAWMEAQALEIKALGDSSKMTDAAKMLRLYEASKVQAIAASNLTQQRQQTLVSASGSPQRSQKTPKPLSVNDMTAEQLWKHEAGIRAKKRERGY